MAYGDGTDGRILGFLRENSRESFVDIGKKLGLSESAVRRRVKNMTEAGVIKKFTVEMGDAGSTSALVLVSVDSATDTSAVSQKLAKLEGVRTVYEITGQYDITTVVTAGTIAEINRSIDALRKVQGVADTNTVIILKKVA
ncbi:MAG: Lrp/AsnC family transcriptional regulator [Nitrosopumilus sp.]|nr:Lrp/AsnC family transcriptional regulator [Nitrosopumilus sp.]CAI9830889.1 HTH-type transcriptional regulator LysM [Nitrosopumilaceae archaeon]MDA7941296.1 Lrp/AsnC family transcriptional regulator [Nitrosopumilus sp.]MDA7942711.1 Lrp/AsnC family transcriptional regulator [Nitrosopumilus sp.]MDA7945303.1 Lrp/AsnC family transcriptional regulator [Nitrosopumilus sp.]